MSTSDDQRIALVEQAVRAEHPDALLIRFSKTTGSVLLRIDAESVFKVPDPEHDASPGHEYTLAQSLREATGPAYQSIFVPATVTTIGGHQGLMSPYFERTLSDVVMSMEADDEAAIKQGELGTVEIMDRLEMLRACTSGPLEESFVEELRITLEYICEALHSKRIHQLPRLAQLATRIQAFIPSESTWCHRDLHLSNVAHLNGNYLLFDPIPTLSRNPDYLRRIEHLKPPFKGHVFLDYARLLVGLDYRVAQLKKDGRLERGNRLLALKHMLERRLESRIGWSSMHIGFALYYGMLAFCKCQQCTDLGGWDVMRAEFERAINQLLGDDLALRLSDTRSVVAVPGGTQGCLLYELPLNERRAVLKINTAGSAEQSDGMTATDEVTRNLAGYRVMPDTLRPTLFASGEYEGLPFLLMQHAGVCLREKLIAPFDDSILNRLAVTLKQTYAASATHDPGQMRQFYERMLDLFEKNLTQYIQPKHGIQIDKALEILRALRRMPTDVLPEWCFWTTTDFTVDNIFWDGDRFVFIDPKEATPGLFEIDLGMFPTLIEIYSRSPRGGLGPIHPSNVKPYREVSSTLAADIRKDADETIDCEPFLWLGQAWQGILSCRFREGGEARELYAQAVARLESVVQAFDTSQR